MHVNIRAMCNAKEYRQQFQCLVLVTPQELKQVGSTNVLPSLSEMRASPMIMLPLSMFLNEPPCDNEAVTDNFDNGFDDDLEAILDSFVGVVSILPAKYRVASQS